jgi:hypothetical protein
MGVQVYGCPISLRVRCMETAVLALMDSAPSSASAANDITALIICDMLSAALLLMGMSSLPAMVMWPPALPQAFRVLIGTMHFCGLQVSCCLLDM